MKTEYHIIGKTDPHELAKRLARKGKLIEPMIELIGNSRIAVMDLFDCLGRMILEMVL